MSLLILLPQTNQAMTCFLFSILLVLVSCLDDVSSSSSSSYQDSIPKCPTPFQSFPCICSKTSLESPLNVFCTNGNLASISLPLKVYFAKESLPLRNITIRDGNFAHLAGSLFKGLNNVSSLSIESCSIEAVGSDVLIPLVSSLRVLSLSGNHLPSIPTESLKLLNLTHLDVSNNSIGSLTSMSFPKSISSLVFLNLSHNSISKIESSTFSPFASSLEELDVSHNQVSKLERNLFKGMKKIRILNLSHNQYSSFDRSDFVELLGLQVIRLAGMTSNLSKLPQSIFARNAQLQTIDISDNVFVEVDAYVTRGVRFLRKYIASGNKITSIAKRAFSTNTRIRAIDLSRNLLTSIPSDMFTGLQYLDFLDLSHNQIKTVDPGAFQSIFKIDINLSHNQLNFLARSSFVECSNISILDVSHNNLSRIHAEAFIDSDVSQLILNHNSISNLTHIPIGNLTSIRYLNLSHNQIESVNRKSFGLRQNTKLYEGAIVDLSFNRLKELSGSMFEKFWALRHLNLSNNHFVRLGFGAFGNLPTLLDLNLDNNPHMKDIGSINGLISLKTLYARNNSLKSIPTVSVALNELHLEDNKIDSISCSSFPMINSLLSLHLRNNFISSVDPDSFCNLLTLREVDLSRNNISDVEQVSASLQRLSSLQSLDLSFNSIPAVNTSNAFGNLPTLFSINLSGNKISQVSAYAFNGLLQLLSLNMSRNLMTRIEYDSLKGLVSLQTLDLSHNTLTRIENRTNSFFEDLLSLESLYLSGNRLSFLTPKSLPSSQWVPYKLRLLDLSHNHLESVSTAVGFAPMHHLILHHNHIRTLIPGVFGNMSSLQLLDLSNNRLTHIPLHGFSFNATSKDSFLHTLRHLNLSHNRIDVIDSGELARISGSSSLGRSQSSSSSVTQIFESLDLSFNRISLSWPDADISLLVGRGVSVNMTGNPFPCTCSSRLKVDSVRKSVQRISPRLAKMLTFNHDVNTYSSQDSVILNFTSTVSLIMNQARSDWDSLTCPVETLVTRKSSRTTSRRRSRTRKPRNVAVDELESSSSDASVSSTTIPSVTSTTTEEPIQDLRISHLSSEDLSCSEQESPSLLEGDVLFRGISWLRGRSNSLRVVWFIRNEVDDIANIRLERSEVDPNSDSTSESLEISYTEREYTFNDLNPRKSHRICLKAFDSTGRQRPSFPSSCQTSQPKPR